LVARRARGVAICDIAFLLRKNGKTLIPRHSHVARRIQAQRMMSGASAMVCGAGTTGPFIVR